MTAGEDVNRVGLVAQGVYFKDFDDPDFRFGKKVQVLTIGNTCTVAVVTRSNIKSFKGWYQIPDIPAHMKPDGYRHNF